MSLHTIWHAFQSCHFSPLTSHLPISDSLRSDNPFIINYVVYHHYKSLGWVIKSGIKFCVDYLLYKRGPVFNHAEYAFSGSTFLQLLTRSSGLRSSFVLSMKTLQIKHLLRSTFKMPTRLHGLGSAPSTVSTHK